MASVGLENLSLTSYNCEHADDIRLPFMKQIFSQCDFLFIQEHGLFKSSLSWFNALGDDVCIHGVSAMDEGQLIRGRPHGGAAIMWRSTLGHHVSAISLDSKRMCAITVDVATEKLLIVCVYMPCDDGLNDHNVLEYKEILDNIDVLCHSTNATMLCVGGDFNTDLSRDTPQTQALNVFCNDNELFCCAKNENLNFNFTFCSKINGRQTFIDHFIISDNLRDNLASFESIDSVLNPSDHNAIKCSFNLNISYDNFRSDTSHIERPVWDSASDYDIEYYKECLNDYLLSIPLPIDLIQCNNFKCKGHGKEITEFHNNIVDGFIKACNDSIPSSKPKPKAKVVPGWNDNVEHYFQTAQFWHKLWLDNGRPQEDIISKIRQKTRSNYYKDRRYVIKKMTIRKTC